jgi:putative spermidine/putrescine transport system ATP-binding protein
VIYVTHDQEEALVLSDRIAVMRDGRFEQVGSPREVYDRPANAFVAAFLGSSNRLHVELERDGSAVRVLPRDGGQQPGWRLPAQLAPEGDQAVLMVRPERVALVDPAAPQPPDRLRQSATVSDAAFLGDHLRVECKVLDEHVWTLRLDPAQAPTQLPHPGNHCCLEWATTDTRLLAP